jgi:putative ABC transport system ATP-binding protein
MIEAQGIAKSYRDGTMEVRAVDRTDIRINKGDFILIIGRSGSGKSTLLSMLGGLTRPSEGRILLEGKDIQGLDDRQLSDVRANQFGFIFQFPGLIPTLTAEENILLPSLFTGRASPPDNRARELLDSFGLADKLSAYPSQLSGGELKRVAIARSLVNDPSVILADEPSADLDVATEKVVMEYLGRINRTGKTIIMVTHCVELSPYANRVFSMEKGVVSEVTSEYVTSARCLP